MKNIIEVNSLKKKYEDYELNINELKLQEGKIYGIVGKNGAGKSTFIKLILGLTPCDFGNIRVLGTNNIDCVKEDIGVVFDTCCFSGILNSVDINYIFKNVYLNSWNEEIFYKLIKKFGILRDKDIENFSNGMKAKLGLAVALSHSPKLLILDESTSGLDPIIRKDVNNIIKEYSSKGNTVLFSTHIISELEDFVDSIIVIENGEIILIEDVKKFYSNSKVSLESVIFEILQGKKIRI